MTHHEPHLSLSMCPSDNLSDPYEAAAATVADMVSFFPGNPFAGLRSVLGSAIRLPPGLTRKAAIRSRLAALLPGTYYIGGAMWQTSAVYRNTLVAMLDEMCGEAMDYEQAMAEMRDAAATKRHGHRTAPDPTPTGAAK